MSTHFFVAGCPDVSNNPTELPIGLRYSNTIYYDNSSNIYVNDVNCNSLNYTSLDPPIPAGATGQNGFDANSSIWNYNTNALIGLGDFNYNQNVTKMRISI